MEQEEVTLFAKTLVEIVRDAAIKSADIQLHTHNLKSPIARRWHEKKSAGDFNKFGEEVIADCVDTTIFYFLLAMDDGMFNVSFNSPEGKQIPITGEIIGELGGWYMGEWRSQYSKERCPDDLDDI